jgi:hypothetical protein
MPDALKAEAVKSASTDGSPMSSALANPLQSDDAGESAASS